MILERDVIDRARVQGLDDGGLRDVAEKRDLFAVAFRDRLFAAAKQDVRLHAEAGDLTNAMLRRLGLELAGRLDPGNERRVNADSVVAPEVVAELAKRFDVRQAFDVAHRAPDFADHEIAAVDLGKCEFLDGIGDMLTAKQRELLQFIDQRLKADGISPSFDEMREALDLKSKSGVHRLISALEERQFIRRLPNRARALEVLKMPDVVTPITAAASAIKTVVPAAANDTLDIPLHGRIAAGTPIEALQGTESFSVPAALLGPGEHYALEVSGDSMVEEGILDGDFALIRKADSARDGEIVVALIDDEEATLKTYRREGQMIRLDPANRSYEPQRYSEDRVRIQGRLAGLIRRY